MAPLRVQTKGNGPGKNAESAKGTARVAVLGDPRTPRARRTGASRPARRPVRGRRPGARCPTRKSSRPLNPSAKTPPWTRIASIASDASTPSAWTAFLPEPRSRVCSRARRSRAPKLVGGTMSRGASSLRSPALRTTTVSTRVRAVSTRSAYARPTCGSGSANGVAEISIRVPSAAGASHALRAPSKRTSASTAKRRSGARAAASVVGSPARSARRSSDEQARSTARTATWTHGPKVCEQREHWPVSVLLPSAMRTSTRKSVAASPSVARTRNSPPSASTGGRR